MDQNPPGWKKAFNSDARIRQYDAAINLLALRRKERFRVLRTLLPLDPGGEFHILDLGSGTGQIARQLASYYPKAQILAVDGAPKMIAYARSKRFFQDHRERIKWALADYASPSWRQGVGNDLNLVVSFDALHHLTHPRKRELYQEIHEMLRPGGLLIISDHMGSGEPFYEDPQFILWTEEVRNVLAQSKGKNALNLLRDKLFVLLPRMFRSHLRQDIQEDFVKRLLEEGENPMPLMRHVDALCAVGFANVTVEYRYSQFAIISARKDDENTD